MKKEYRDLRAVIHPVGVVVMGFGVTIAICALVGWGLKFWDLDTHPNVSQGIFGLALSAVVTVLIGLMLFFYGKRFRKISLNRIEAVFAVVLIWVATAAFGGLPFLIGADMSVFDSLFESTSGLTTTGATVIRDIEGRLSKPLLLWRSLIQWLGGMGIVVLFVAVFPSVGAGGKHMFREEVPGAVSEGLKPRIAETSFTLWKLYAFFTFVEFGILWALGMSPFESVSHAFTTMSTGGFSTRNASIGAFESSAIEYTIAIFMLIGTVNYGLYYGALKNRSFRLFFRSVEFRVFIVLVVVITLILTLGNLEIHAHDVETSFRKSLFMVATSISSTGYGSDNYTVYPSVSIALMLLLMLVGGCSGSTAGGIKVERMILMAKQSWVQIRQSFRPNVIHVVRMGRNVVSTIVLADVVALFIVYMASLGLGIILVSTMEQVPVPTAFGAMLTCLSNMGPAPFHDWVRGAEDNFAAYSAGSKAVFMVAMLLGRLEFFTLLSLLVPGFWKR